MASHTSNAPSAERYVIRRATASDVDAVARIWYTGWLDAHLGNVPPELIRYRSRESFTPRTRDRIPATWVLESGGEVVGFVVVADDELEQIYVDAAARGTGVAGKLLQQAEREIRSAGHRKAWLAVVAGNGRARAFYARLGWRDAGPFDYLAETDDGPLAVPCHRYEIDLADRVG